MGVLGGQYLQMFESILPPGLVVQFPVRRIIAERDQMNEQGNVYVLQ